MRFIRSPRRTAAELFLSGLFLTLLGCSGNSAGTVSGTVTYKSKPVAAGTVNFVLPAKGSATQAPLDASGNFTLPGSLEAGTYKIYIQPPIPEPVPPGMTPKTVPNLAIPPKYQDPGQTPVTREVKSGPNTFAINLE